MPVLTNPELAAEQWLPVASLGRTADLGLRTALGKFGDIAAAAIAVLRRLNATLIGLPDDYGLVLGTPLSLYRHPTWTDNGNGSYTRSVAGWGGLGGTRAGMVGKVCHITFKVDSITAGTSLGIYRRNAANTDNDLLTTINVVAGQTYTASGLIVFDFSQTLWIDNNTFSGTISNLVVREILSAQHFIDSTGTQPVTAINDLVGLTLDRVGTVGAELPKSVGAGWVDNGNGSYTHAVAGWATLGAWQTGAVGKYYRITFKVDSITAGSTIKVFRRNVGNTFNDELQTINISAGNTYTSGIFPITYQQDPIIWLDSDTFTGTISQLSVKELTGNHATQATTASKPLVARVPRRLGPNLVSNGGFDSDVSGWATSYSATAAWVAGRAQLTIASGQATARLRVSAPLNLDTSKSYVISGSVQNISGTVASYLKVSTSASLDSAYVNTPTVASGVTSQANAVFTPASSVVYVGGVVDGVAGNVGSFDNIEVREVLEWTNALSFDGSNDFLQTGITTGNEGWVCAGVTLTSTAPSNQSIFYSGADGDATAGAWLAVSSGTVRCSVGNGTTRNQRFGAAIPAANTPFVIDGGWNAAEVFVGLNGSTLSAAKAIDCTTANTFRIGYTAGGSPLTGPMTALIYTPTLPSAADRALIRKWIGSLQGQAL
jgi:hypothetical protein